MCKPARATCGSVLCESDEQGPAESSGGLEIMAEAANDDWDGEGGMAEESFQTGRLHGQAGLETRGLAPCHHHREAKARAKVWLRWQRRRESRRNAAREEERRW